MSRRKAKTLEWMLSAVASGCLAFAPATLFADEPVRSDPALSCPLAENQCSEYLYEPYPEAAALQPRVTGTTHDFPAAYPAPIIPAITDTLQGHAPQFYGCGDYDGVRLTHRESLDYWGEHNYAVQDTVENASNDLDQLAHIERTLGASFAQDVNEIDFQGTCYEQTLFSESADQASLFPNVDSALWEGLVEDVVSGAMKRVNSLREEYRPYDMLLVPNRPATDYWQAHAHLNIDATWAASAAAVDYWAAHAHLNINPVVPRQALTLASLSSAPALARTYADWVLSHDYVQNPAAAKQDLYHQIEMKLCGTPALDKWIGLAYSSRGQHKESTASAKHVGRDSVLWFADYLDRAGQQLQTASQQLSRWANAPTREARLR